MKLLWQSGGLCSLLVMGSCTYCATYVYPENFRGVVTRKYIVRNNRNAHVLVIMERAKRFSIETYVADTIPLYSEVLVGDSVIKRAGSNSYRVKNHEKDIVYSVDCQ